jgi:PD-(D/E)XK nuclease superfamily
MNTNDKQTIKEAGHWYSQTGEPRYVQLKKDGSGMRATTIADARKQNLLPSVTTVLKAADKPALTQWLRRTAILAALTTPRLPNETEDEFADRVLTVDAESISTAAKDKGTAIHGAIECALTGKDYSEIAKQFLNDFTQDIELFVKPAVEACLKFGKPIANERVVVGDGYAGKLDTLCWKEELKTLTVVDFKTASKIPKAQYDEHVMQLGCYAAGLAKNTEYDGANIETANIYISTTNPGEVATLSNPSTEWSQAYEEGFKPLFAFWQWKNNYQPKLQ